MEIELSGTVRGEAVIVSWHEGELVGSEAILKRLDPLLDDGRCDITDLTSVIQSIELVAGQRMRMRVVDGRDGHPPRVGSAA